MSDLSTSGNDRSRNLNEFREWVVKQKNKADDAAQGTDSERSARFHDGELSAFHDVERRLVELGLVDRDDAGGER